MLLPSEVLKVLHRIAVNFTSTKKNDTFDDSIVYIDIPWRLFKIRIRMRFKKQVSDWKHGLNVEVQDPMLLDGTVKGNKWLSSDKSVEVGVSTSFDG